MTCCISHEICLVVLQGFKGDVGPKGVQGPGGARGVSLGQGAPVFLSLVYHLQFTLP